MCLRPIKTPLGDFLLHFSHILPDNLEVVKLINPKLYQVELLYVILVCERYEGCRFNHEDTFKSQN